MNEQSMRFRIGIFVLAAMILLAVLIMLFGSFPSLLKRHSNYAVIFNNAPGVAAGTPVRRSGVRIGQVKDVVLDDATGKVRITIMIEYPHPLYESDQAVLVHGLLSGDTSIDFVPRPPNGHPVELAQAEPGTEFIGGAQADVSTLINQTSGMVPTAREALNDISKTLQRYEKMAPLVEDTLREYRELGKAAREIVPDVQAMAKAARETMPDIRDFAKSAKEMVPELRRTNNEIFLAVTNWGRLGERLDLLLETNQDKLVKALDSLTDTIGRVARFFSDENQRAVNEILRNTAKGSQNLETLSRSADDLLKEGRGTLHRMNDSISRADRILTNLEQATKPIAERSGSVMQNLDESSQKLNKILSELRDFLRALNEGDGTFRRFMLDPALYNNLNEAACAFTRLLPRLDRIMKDIEVFADKIARHPESLGVRGAINPSSGLKDVKDVPSTSSFWRGPGSH